ncbi:unnamed protein product [Sphagnum jensenii]|uniref:Uncharacterized protein n=1 Tax=Sphagnum jensenii TaxID=128206 RepID=A0ABP1BK05_9BRYO
MIPALGIAKPDMQTLLCFNLVGSNANIQVSFNILNMLNRHFLSCGVSFGIAQSQHSSQAVMNMCTSWCIVKAGSQERDPAGEFQSTVSMEESVPS